MSKTFISRRQLMKASVAAAAYSMLPTVTLANERADVVVVGAGLSGLYAASTLEAAGFNVQVLEGQKRIGGRIYTLDHIPGKPESGGQTIGSTYGRTIFAARRLGVELEKIEYKPGPEPIQQLLNIGGRRINPADWSQSSANPFTGPTRQLLPDWALFELLGDTPFKSGDDWVTEEFFHLDRPVADFLRENGVSRKAIKLLGHNFDYGDNLDRTSLLFFLRVKAVLMKGISTPGGQMRVIGGNQRLPEAMASALQRPVIQGKVVTAIVQNGDEMEVQCEDGTTYKSRYVVAAVPLPAMRNIKVIPGMPKLQAEAAKKVAYGRVVQVHLRIKRPFWQGTGFMPNIYSDSVIERIFATDPQNMGNLTNMTVWINGDGTKRYARKSKSAIESAVMSRFGKLLPEAKGAVEVEDVVGWTPETRFAGGSFATWAPGQVAKYSNVISKPHGSLFFAGEHTGVWSSGIEGALESGERVANEIISRI